jgi:hypothetical protein
LFPCLNGSQVNPDIQVEILTVEWVSGINQHGKIVEHFNIWTTIRNIIVWTSATGRFHGLRTAQLLQAMLSFLLIAAGTAKKNVNRL